MVFTPAFFWFTKAPFGLKWCPKNFHKKGVSVLLLLPRHNFWTSVGCNVWSTFFSHPNSQNNGGATLQIALKFSTKCDATLHPCNTPNKGGYTIEHSHGTPYFRSGPLACLEKKLINMSTTYFREPNIKKNQFRLVLTTCH